MGSDAILQNVPLAPLTTLGIGGLARRFARVERVEDIAAATLSNDGSPCVLGGGSNLVIADEGIDDLVLQIAIQGISERADGVDTIISAGAGTSWDSLVNFAVERNLAGLECLSGIPGTVGGTPIQNVGAYGQEVSSVIEYVRAFDPFKGRMTSFTAAECGFSYRASRFKKKGPLFIISEVAFRLRRDAPPTLTYRDVFEYFERRRVASPDVRAVREAILEIRRSKGMVIDSADPDTRSVGSFFMNPVLDRAAFDRIAPAPHYLMDNDTVKIPAAWLIEQSGFRRGHVDGAVGLSSKHPLAIINRGGASARDVVRLASRIKRTVMEKFGVALRPEPVFVGFGDDPDVSYLRG